MKLSELKARYQEMKDTSLLTDAPIGAGIFHVDVLNALRELIQRIEEAEEILVHLASPNKRTWVAGYQYPQDQATAYFAKWGEK